MFVLCSFIFSLHFIWLFHFASNLKAMARLRWWAMSWPN
jgi:hypothetical protein